MANRRPEWLSRVKKEIWRKFPDLEAVEPRLSTRRLVAKGGKAAEEDRCLHTLTFRKRVRLDDGTTSTRIVQVVADDEGRILKVVCSR